MNNLTFFLLLVCGTILLKIVVTWIKGKISYPIEKANTKNFKEQNLKGKEQNNLKTGYDGIYQEPHIFKVDFNSMSFSNPEWDKYKRTIIDNTSRLNSYYDVNIEELLVNSVDKCYEYYQETFSSVNLICNQAGIHNINVRHLMDLFCLTIIQSSLWALNSYKNYPYDDLNEFKNKCEFTDIQSNIQTISNMLGYIKMYPFSTDIMPRYNHSTQIILRLKKQYNFQIR